jgi:hypothetical protein
LCLVPRTPRRKTAALTYRAAMKPTAPKPRAPKAPPLAFDRKLLTLWRQAAEKAAQSRYASLAKLLGQPGVWAALAAGLDGGQVPVAALWRLGQHATDHVPARFAVDLLRALPVDGHSLGSAHELCAVPVLAQALVDPAAFDALADAPELARDLVAIARIQAGVDPAASASPRVREALCARWVIGSFTAAAVVDGQAARVGAPGSAVAPLDAMRALGDRLFGHDAFARALADALRRQVAVADAAPSIGPRTTVHPSEPALVIAAEVMTPEETGAYAVGFGTWRAVVARWSLDDHARAALATVAHGRPERFTSAGCVALLAVERDPACAPTLEPALRLVDFSGGLSPGLEDAYRALARTDPAWLRGFLERWAFDPEHWRGPYAAPLALTLLVTLDPDAAERLAARSADLVDFGRLHGLDAGRLLAALEASGPAVRRGLMDPLVQSLARRPAASPERVDALVSFDGTWRDPYVGAWLVGLPLERALAVARREVSAGRGELVRASLTAASNGAALLTALDGGPAAE